MDAPPSEPHYDLTAASSHADPAPLFDQMRRRHPIYRDGVLGAWVMTRYDDVARVVRDPSFSVDRGGSISRTTDPDVQRELAWCSEFALRWMVFADPPRHTRLRSAVHRAFTGASVEQLRPALRAATSAALDAVAPAARIEILADLSVPVPARVTAELLGLPPEDVHLLKQWTADMFRLFGAGVAPAPTVRAAYGSMRACRDYFADVVAARRNGDGDDLLSAIVRSPEARALEEEELIGLSITLLAGAYETTTHLVGNGVWALLRHPRELAGLRAEPTRIGNAIEELFRFDGPAFSVVRRACDDVQIGNAVIPAGDNVYCMLHAANRDPERFPDPDRLDCARRDTRHVGLGAGAHFCLGAALSRIEAAVMIEAVVHELPNLALDMDALGGEAPTYTPNLAIRGLRALPLRFTAHRR